jgi:hypothetical protein
MNQEQDDPQRQNADQAYTGATRRLPSLRIIDKRTNQEMRCPKCNAPMEQGWIPELSQQGASLPVWKAGRPRKRWMGGYRVRDTRRHLIITLRCVDCGFLESYAP